MNPVVAGAVQKWKSRIFLTRINAKLYAGTVGKQVSPLAVASLRTSVEMTVVGGGVIDRRAPHS